MLKRGLVLVFVLVVAVGVFFRRTPQIQRESASAREIESTREITRESERAPETEEDVAIAHDDEAEAARPLVEHLAEIRGEVHLLEMQRLDARARHDDETAARLDAEISALRAENARLRGAALQPEGI